MTQHTKYRQKNQVQATYCTIHVHVNTLGTRLEWTPSHRLGRSYGPGSTSLPEFTMFDGDLVHQQHSGDVKQRERPATRDLLITTNLKITLADHHHHAYQLPDMWHRCMSCELQLEVGIWRTHYHSCSKISGIQIQRTSLQCLWFLIFLCPWVRQWMQGEFVITCTIKGGDMW